MEPGKGKPAVFLFLFGGKPVFTIGDGVAEKRWRLCFRLRQRVFFLYGDSVSGIMFLPVLFPDSGIFPDQTNGWAAGFWKSVSPVSAKTVNRVIFYGENTGRKCRVSLGGKNGSLCMPDSVGFWQEPFRQPADNRKPPGFTTVSAMKGNEILFFQTGSWLVLY